MQRLHRSSRVLRRARVFTPPLCSRTEMRQTGKALDMAVIRHLKEVADLMQCSKSAEGRAGVVTKYQS